MNKRFQWMFVYHKKEAYLSVIRGGGLFVILIDKEENTNLLYEQATEIEQGQKTCEGMCMHKRCKSPHDT
jgi:hypothetical protein